MTSLHHRSKFAFCLAIVLLSLSLIFSCNPTKPEPEPSPDPARDAKSDAREDLVRSLKGENVDGYNFATEEDETQAVASLTNGAVRKLINLDSSTANLVLRYTRVKDKAKNNTRTYKAAVAKDGKELTLLVTDFATGEVITKQKFPPPEPHLGIGCQPTFDSLEDCVNDFNCKRLGALQCEANRTCQNQFAAMICCLKDGQCFSVHMIIPPTRPLCNLRDIVPDFEGLVLSRK